MPPKTKIVDPAAYFSSWHYHIRPALWDALGVPQRKYVDKEKTAIARQVAIQNGYTAAQAKKIKRFYFAHILTNPIAYDFHEGDIFYPRHGGEKQGLQVAVVKELLEVHVFQNDQYTHAHHITPSQFAHWLRTSAEPTETRIQWLQSWRELSKYYDRKATDTEQIISIEK